MIIFGEQPLRDAIDDYVEHYHLERPHQGIGNVLIQPTQVLQCIDDPVQCRDRLGGLLRSYHRIAA